MVDIGFIFNDLAKLFVQICNINFSFAGFNVNVAGLFVFVIIVALIIRVLNHLSE